MWLSSHIRFIEIVNEMEARIPKDHPLRTLKTVLERHLKALTPKFEEMQWSIGPPEFLRKGSTCDAPGQLLERTGATTPGSPF